MCGQMAVHNQFSADIFKFSTDIEFVPLCVTVVNPWHACTVRVTVVVLCVCLSVHG